MRHGPDDALRTWWQRNRRRVIGLALVCVFFFLLGRFQPQHRVSPDVQDLRLRNRPPRRGLSFGLTVKNEHPALPAGFHGGRIAPRRFGHFLKRVPTTRRPPSVRGSLMKPEITITACDLDRLKMLLAMPPNRGRGDLDGLRDELARPPSVDSAPTTSSPSAAGPASREETSGRDTNSPSPGPTKPAPRKQVSISSRPPAGAARPLHRPADRLADPRRPRHPPHRSGRVAGRLKPARPGPPGGPVACKPDPMALTWAFCYLIRVN